eukprot:TRINITY_DN16484_c0_g1_i2.p1 TRINITY_DN16484_c0_g1~~TRINITY_DN16484_c0_g1_i2.p1  ORF type:complete len:1059 (-),score=144.64 TRINITY_DN16484_c0_g1_i2:9-3158(-)
MSGSYPPPWSELPGRYLRATSEGPTFNTSLCGVTKPLFKDNEQVQPLWQTVGNFMFGWLNFLKLPWMRGEPDKSQLECLMPYMMNCTHWHSFASQEPCPKKCPFVAQLKPFACTFSCVAGHQCHFADLDSPFANPDTLLCEPALVQGCRVAAEGGAKCLDCRANFTLANNGTSCSVDAGAHVVGAVEFWTSRTVREHWAVAVSILAVIVMFFAWLCKRDSSSSKWEFLRAARLHHHLCKVRKSPKAEASSPLFSLFENVHVKWILGAGFSLYYNSLAFIFAYSLCLLTGVYLILHAPESSIFNYASGVSDPSICGLGPISAADQMQSVQDTVERFMRRLATTVLILYFVVLVGMLLFAWFQLRHKEWFDMEHLTMRDLALEVSGLPASVTDEVQISKFFLQRLGLEVKAVSIGYDFESRRAEVEALIDRHLQYADAAAHDEGGTGGGDAAASVQPGAAAKPVAIRMVSSDASSGEVLCPAAVKWDQERVREWFAPGSSNRMLGTGSAFVVFGGRRERDAALAKVENERDSLVWTEGVHLRVTAPECEPTNINWGNLGIGGCRRCCGTTLGVSLYILACAGFVLGFYRPYAKYVTSYLDQVGSFPQGILMNLLGVLIGLTFWLMIQVIENMARLFGLRNVEQEGVVIFVAFTAFCVAVPVFNVFLTWYFTERQWADPSPAFLHQMGGRFVSGPVSSLRNLRLEIDFGFKVFQLLVPGLMFTPSLVNPLNMFLIPYFRDTAMLAMGRTKNVRETEKYLEPLQMSLALDYQAHISVPFCCGLSLFVVSPSMLWIHLTLVIWIVFYYFFQRVLHLRLFKKVYFTTNKLDRVCLYFGWGLLLAQLAACYAYWKVRLQEWNVALIPAAVVLSFTVYFVLLRCVVGVRLPLSLIEHLCWLCGCHRRKAYSADSPEPSHRTSEEVCYSWTNVNPVHVLKSQYCRDLMMDQAPCIFYDPGKEYLQVPRGRKDQILRGKGLHLELEGLGCLCVPGAEEEPLLRSEQSASLRPEAGTELMPKDSAASPPSVKSATALLGGEQSPADRRNDLLFVEGLDGL